MQSVVIGHVALHSRADKNGDAAQRLRAERWVQALDFSVPGLPSSAVLIVRTLTTPMDEYSQTGALNEQPRDRLRKLYESAARPAVNHHLITSTSNADSVVFADESELLASLTRDSLSCRLTERWYWQQVLRSILPMNWISMQRAEALSIAWSVKASCLPGAFGILDPLEVSQAIELLTPAQVLQVIRSLHGVFSLPPGVLDMLERQAPPGAHGFVTEGISSMTRLHTTPPWESHLRGVEIMRLSSAFATESHYLIGLAYTLCRAPSFARSQAFASQAVDWLAEEQLANQHNKVHSLTDIFTGEGHKDARTEETAQSTQLSHPGEDKSDHTYTTLEHATESTAAANPDSAASNPGSSELLEDLSENQAAKLQFGAAQSFPEEGVQTMLAGAFYLINLLTWLDLPNGWDGILSRCLSSWGAIEVLARGLLGTDHDHYVEDPLWSILKLLDSGFSPSGMEQAYRLPPRVAAHGCSAHPRWITTKGGGRLRFFDETDGFLVVDIPAAGDPGEEIEIYRKQGIDVAWHWGDAPSSQPLAENILRALHPAAVWWLERSLGLVQSLLGRLLDAQPNTLASLLLCHPGRLVVSRTHIDVVMSMDSICLPIRRAGLDRDPGWVPDLGRIVLFHFE